MMIRYSSGEKVECGDIVRVGGQDGVVLQVITPKSDDALDYAAGRRRSDSGT